MQTSIFISDILLHIEFWINCTYVCTWVDDKNKETKVVTHTYIYTLATEVTQPTNVYFHYQICDLL